MRRFENDLKAWFLLRKNSLIKFCQTNYFIIMTRIFTNPQAFQKECADASVSLELLLESQICKGKQETARCFSGKCKRGDGTTASSALVEDWIETLKYAKEHPEEKDKDPYQRPRSVIPLEKWNEFVEIFSTPIESSVVESWKKMSKKRLADEAEKYGITIGTRNNKANINLLERMLEMVERRRTNFWNHKKTIQTPKTEENLKLSNMNILKGIAKKMGIEVNQTKEALINCILEKRQQLIEDEKTLFVEKYEDMSFAKLKIICSERSNIRDYNNLKTKEELIQKLKESDENRHRNIFGNIEIQSRPSDCYINATQLCKAGGREFRKWNEMKESKEFVKELSKKLNLTRSNLIQTVNDKENRYTWVHPQIAIDIAQWISPEFRANVSTWIEELLNTGSVSIGQPVNTFRSLNDFEREARQLEQSLVVDEYTSHSCIYIAYIGRGLVKIGFSDGNITNRNFKHLSSESEYHRFQIIKLFQVSGRPMEKQLHEQLFRYRVEYNKQKEIFQPTSTLEHFIMKIEKYLRYNDLLMINHRLQDERDELEKKLEVSQKQVQFHEETIKRLELQIICLRNGIDFDKMKLNE